MSKVKLILTEKHLSALVYSLDQASKVPAKERIAKVAKSVLDKSTLYFKKKQLEVKLNANLFNKDKKYKFSIELVEAHFLEQYLLSMSNFPLCEYDRNAVNWITATINKQLV